MTFSIKANIQFMKPNKELKVKYLIFAQVKTENPTFDKKNKTITSFQTKFYKIVYAILLIIN